ncbi:hypothetical protein [Bythopirellula polymerisocia]|uniref:Uncharacterized protein n=1 Tax=Bythopirellula polymerisocia TaxID=2528003 RepID=A0A5C6CKT1_9BACT|nr:hypothetical protein [Bythopirellula polymerisocia]TWU24665.1 hypothetical protein Pla144_35510 [Bythopirellula polymerisocia]
MANSQSPTPAPSSADSRHELPPVTVDGHALFEFSLKLNRALKRLETRYGATDKHKIPYFRDTWQQASRKPR